MVVDIIGSIMSNWASARESACEISLVMRFGSDKIGGDSQGRCHVLHTSRSFRNLKHQRIDKISHIPIPFFKGQRPFEN